MEESVNIYEPLDLYKNQYREEHEKNVKDFFEELVTRSGVNEEENIQTVKEIRKKEKEIPEVEKKRKTNQKLKNFLIFLTIVSFSVGVFYCYSFIKKTNNLTPIVNISVSLGCIFLGVGFILIIVKKLNKILKNLDEYIKLLNDKKDELYKEAWNQMRPLNNLYDWSMTATLVQKTIPLVKMDPYFDSKRFDFLHSKYGLRDNTNVDESVIFIQSGDIIDNPFLVTKTLNHWMGNKTYYGELEISWIESKTVNGETVYETKTQTLKASVTKPHPEYFYNSYIIYGNEAAPDLSFSRKPSDIQGMSDKQIQKKVDKEGKKLDKKARVSVEKGSNFTTMTNTEFDVLFNAVDRDNEVQFRLLFTPLAQQQILNLIKDNKVGYGDNWRFVKRKKINYIYPDHLNKLDMSTDPNRYVSYELAKSRKVFNEYNNNYFKGFYFAIAPLLAIPLYQQHRHHDFIYKDVYPNNVSSWEHEAIVNYFDESEFEHPQSITRNILKTQLIGSGKDYDEISVTAYGFRGIERVDYISVLGKDGNYHNVPVVWIEYIPVEKTSSVVVKVADELNRGEFINNKYGNENWQRFINTVSSSDNFIFRKSMCAFIAKTRYNSEVDRTFDRILSKENKE